ncbi:MAG: serine/threonine-protein kinase [Planctomycetia bacterium]
MTELAGENRGREPIVCPECGMPRDPEAAQGLCPGCLLRQAAVETGSWPSSPPSGSTPSLEAVQAAFQNLEIIKLIGSGGMGSVFLARQPKLDRYVAVKILAERLARQPEFAERFLREGQLLAKLHHPNIVTVHDIGQAGGFFYLIMEYVAGVNLREAMRAEPLTPEQALVIVPQICEALQFAHQQGVLHRDIKPENILLDTQGRVKIADFGIAKLVDRGKNTCLTGDGAVLGTLYYMAPEQFESPSTVDHRADIYSLGVVFYELLTGELPIGRFAPPSEKATVDAGLDQVVFKSLERERDRRQQSAEELRTDVKTATERPPHVPSGQEHTASTPTDPPYAEVLEPFSEQPRQKTQGPDVSKPFPERARSWWQISWDEDIRPMFWPLKIAVIATVITALAALMSSPMKPFMIFVVPERIFFLFLLLKRYRWCYFVFLALASFAMVGCFVQELYLEMAFYVAMLVLVAISERDFLKK